MRISNRVLGAAAVAVAASAVCVASPAQAAQPVTSAPVSASGGGYGMWVNVTTLPVHVTVDGVTDSDWTNDNRPDKPSPNGINNYTFLAGGFSGIREAFAVNDTSKPACFTAHLSAPGVTLPDLPLQEINNQVVFQGADPAGNLHSSYTASDGTVHQLTFVIRQAPPQTENASMIYIHDDTAFPNLWPI